MNDDQIRSELERRASSGSSRPDWVRRDLLPYVRQEIAARPQPVVTSRWAPGLSVAAVVAALLIMVIAVPRLTLQPPAASTSPSATESQTDLTILSTAQFSADLAAGRLVGQTVLVEGGISFGSIPAMPACAPPSGLCPVGFLDGTGVVVDARYTPTTDSPGSGTWAAPDGGRDYHFPSLPIDGVLLLRVSYKNAVEFVGLAQLAPDGGSWSVAGAKAISAGSYGSDDAVIVRGFLVDTLRPGEDVFIDCIANPYPLIDGLPNRYCVNTDFIGSEPQTDDPRYNGDRLTVQGGAADSYAGNFQGVEALYAIAPRLYGGCDHGSAPPCWLWDVVARVDGPAAPTPSEPPIASPTPSPVPTAAPITPTSNFATDRKEAAGAAFDLSIRADRSEYSAGDAIDVSSTLLSETTATVSCLSQPIISLEQLDGDLDFYPGPFIQSCPKPQMVFAGNEFTRGFLPAVWALLTPNPMDPYVRDDKLYLPPGTYRFVARASLAVGDPGVGNGLRLEASIVIRVAEEMPTPTPPIGTRVLSCEASEALGDPGITLIDHSGRIGGCSIAQADFIPDGPIDVTTTRLPLQLAATWTVNAGCPADEQLEFWGPIDQPIGLTEFVLQLARQRDAQFEPATCGDVLDVRQVQIGLTVDDVRPADILAISVDRSIADGKVSSQSADGSFDLHLAAQQAQVPNEPIDITSRLTYNGTDPVTLSYLWRPDFIFTPLTAGQRFIAYGDALICGNAEVNLDTGDGVSGHLSGPTNLDPSDQNYDYRKQYADDGQFRLPAGAYLISTAVDFVVGSNCNGARVYLRNAIVIEVGLTASSGILDSPVSP